MTEKNEESKLNKKDLEKIDSLKGIIEEAEKSLYSARAMLTRLEGKSQKSGGGGYQKKTYGASPDGKVVEGVFDGQLMIGNDGRQYPVPANYASKSKLVEGDMLKLTITDDGNFIYKQIGPVDRKRLIGAVKQDDSGNFVIDAEGKNYKVLLASVTYYKAQAGDEVTIIIPRSGEPIWCAIENVTKKGYEEALEGQEKEDEYFMEKKNLSEPDTSGSHTDKTGETSGSDETNTAAKKVSAKKQKRDMNDIVDEWTPSLEVMEKEAADIKEKTKAADIDIDGGNKEAQAGTSGADSQITERVKVKVSSED